MTKQADEWRAKYEETFAFYEDLRKQHEELQASFDLRWNSDVRARKRWQEAHPGNELVWPDHTDLSVWLMERLEKSEKSADEWKKAADIEGERLITTEKRLEKYEAALRLVIAECGMHKLGPSLGKYECSNPWCKAARVALEE